MLKSLVMFRVFLFFIICSLFAGCAGAQKGGFYPVASKTAEADLHTGQMLNPRLLLNGKDVAVCVFQPGPGILASQEIDKISLMIIRGVYDAFQEENSYLQVVTPENIETADFSIEGHVTRISGGSWLGRTKILELEGIMKDIQTGATILKFQDHLTSDASEESLRQLGYQGGKNIGAFVLRAADKN